MKIVCALIFPVEGKDMPIETCSKCGTPLIIGKRVQWCDHGCIFYKDLPMLRSIFYDVHEFTDIFERLSIQLGMGLDPFIAEGSRRTYRYFARGLINMTLEGNSSYLPAERLLGVFCDHSRIWGLASPRPDNYHRGESLRLELENIASIPLVCGKFQGSLEALEGIPFYCEWEGDGERGVLELIADMGKKEELEEEIVVDRFAQPPFHEAQEFQRCPECSVPKQITRINWDLEEGSIYDLVTGRRMMMINAMTIELILDLIAEEVGEHVYMRITQLEREHAREMYTSFPHLRKSPTETSAILAAFGMGLFSINEDEEIEIKLEKPFNIHLAMGKVLGYYESLRGEEVAAEWKLDEQGNLIMRIYH